MDSPFRIRINYDASERRLCDELALVHLYEYGARRNEECVEKVAKMISSRFMKTAQRISKIDLETVVRHLPNGNAGTRAKNLLEELKIKDVESLVRLRRSHILHRSGFGIETANALEKALARCKLELGMLLDNIAA